MSTDKNGERIGGRAPLTSTTLDGLCVAVAMVCLAFGFGLIIIIWSFDREMSDLAARHEIPATYQYRDMTAAGGPMSDGAHLVGTRRLGGV